MSPHETSRPTRCIAALWLAVLFALAGCGDNIGAALHLDTGEIDVVVGAEVEVTASGGAGYQPGPGSLVWSVANPTVARVTSIGPLGLTEELTATGV